MKDFTGSEKYTQELRDRAVIARRISGMLSDEEAAQCLEKHAQDLEGEAKALESRTSADSAKNHFGKAPFGSGSATG